MNGEMIQNEVTKNEATQKETVTASADIVVDKKKSVLPGIIIAVILVLLVCGGIVFYTASRNAGSASRINGKLDVARHYLEERSYEQAVAAFEEILRIDPKNEEAYLGLAEAYVGIGDYDKAIAILGEGIAVIKEDGLEAAHTLETRLADIRNEYEILLTQRDTAGQMENGTDESYGTEYEEELMRNGNSESLEEDEQENLELTDSEEPEGIYLHSDGSYEVTEYNEAGSIVKRLHYKSDDSLDKYEEFEYDADGKCLKESDYKADGTLYGYTVYEYDADGNPVKCTEYTAEGAEVGYSLPMEIAENGVWLKYDYFPPSFMAEEHIVYECDKRGRLLRSTSYYHPSEYQDGASYDAAVLNAIDENGEFYYEPVAYYVTEYDEYGEEAGGALFSATGAMIDFW